MADPPVLTLLLVVVALATWSVAAGERMRPAVLQRLAAWYRADTLQVAMVRAGTVQLVGLVLLSTWCLLAWFLGGAAGAPALTRLMLVVAAVVLGPVWWAQGATLPGTERVRDRLEHAGVPAAHTPTVAGITAWSSLVGAAALVSLGAPSLWLENGST